MCTDEAGLISISSISRFDLNTSGAGAARTKLADNRKGRKVLRIIFVRHQILD